MVTEGLLPLQFLRYVGEVPVKDRNIRHVGQRNQIAYILLIKDFAVSFYHMLR